MVTTFGYVSYLDKRKQISSKFVKNRRQYFVGLCVVVFWKTNFYLPPFGFKFFLFFSFILLNFKFLFSFLFLSPSYLYFENINTLLLVGVGSVSAASATVPALSPAASASVGPARFRAGDPPWHRQGGRSGGL